MVPEQERGGCDAMDDSKTCCLWGRTLCSCLCKTIPEARVGEMFALGCFEDAVVGGRNGKGESDLRAGGEFAKSGTLVG